ncbi:MAG: nucleotide exchange factor GrpE [Solirubrobacterales bacterium]|nr:nucleotide exchange factor GrpE [Solirubrobacterales bacterium]
MGVEERDPSDIQGEGEAVSGAEAPETGSPADPEAATEPAPEDAGQPVEEVEEDPLARVERERDEYLELAQRTRADLDNYRKRVAGETAAALARGRTEMAEGVIACIDNLERVMAAEGLSPSVALEGGLPEDSPVAVQGVVVAYRDLTDALGRVGIEGFDPTGESFDPNLHEAIQAIEARESSRAASSRCCSAATGTATR